jgi:hypothetical protein
MVMIETREGLAAREEICATPGVDGVLVGPADLAVSLGVPPTTELQPCEHADAMLTISTDVLLLRWAMRRSLRDARRVPSSSRVFRKPSPDGRVARLQPTR